MPIIKGLEIQISHPKNQILGNIDKGIKTSPSFKEQVFIEQSPNSKIQVGLTMCINSEKHFMNSNKRQEYGMKS